MLTLLRGDLVKLVTDGAKGSKSKNFENMQVYFEQLLPQYTLNEDLWRLYVQLAEDFCQDQEEKMRIY